MVFYISIDNKIIAHICKIQEISLILTKMKLKYHTDCSVFYDKDGRLFPNPTQTIEELEKTHHEAITKYKSINVSHTSTNNEYDEFDKELLRFNLSNFIERIEWKIDLKLLHQC